MLQNVGKLHNISYNLHECLHKTINIIFEKVDINYAFEENA